MTASPEHFALNTSKAALQTFEIVGNTTLNGVEKFAALNLETARNQFDQHMESSAALTTAKTLDDLFAIQNALTKPTLQGALNYYRNLFAIASESQQTFKKLTDEGYAELTKSLNAALDKAAKTSPTGSDVALAAVRSAISAANSAYASINEASRKASEIAEASLQATTNATTKAIDAIASTSKRK